MQSTMPASSGTFFFCFLPYMKYPRPMEPKKVEHINVVPISILDLCSPHGHPYALGGQMTPPTGLHPEHAWRHDRGCLIQETSPSGSTQTRPGTGPGGRVRP